MLWRAANLPSHARTALIVVPAQPVRCAAQPRDHSKLEFERDRVLAGIGDLEHQRGARARRRCPAASVRVSPRYSCGWKRRIAMRFSSRSDSGDLDRRKRLRERRVVAQRRRDDQRAGHRRMRADVAREQGEAASSWRSGRRQPRRAQAGSSQARTRASSSQSRALGPGDLAGEHAPATARWRTATAWCAAGARAAGRRRTRAARCARARARGRRIRRTGSPAPAWVGTPAAPAAAARCAACASAAIRSAPAAVARSACAARRTPRRNARSARCRAPRRDRRRPA